MRVGTNVKGEAFVMVDGEWMVRKNVQYPEGWYLVHPKYVHPEDFQE